MSLKFALLVALLGVDPPLVSAGAPTLAPCHLHGIAEAVQCGSVQVPAKRKPVASAERLTIHFARVPARTREAEPDPLFILAGGPGQSAQDFASLVPRFFKQIQRRRDVVLVDVRGTGSSQALRCGLDSDFGAAFGAALHSCRQSLPEDLSGFTTEEQMADVDAVREHLGYPRVNLWGGSFGTRAALVYARLFEDRVRTLILDGAVPLDHPFPVHTARDSQSAFDALVEACARNSACDAAFPSLAADLRSLIERLSTRPASFEMDDPVTARPRKVTMNKDVFVSSVKLMLYTPQHSRLVPFAIRRAVSGDFRPLVAAAEAGLAWTRDAMALGTTAQLGCAEDYARAIRTGVLSPEVTANTFLGRTDITTWANICAAFAPVESDVTPRVLAVPALVLSGGFDPVTPPVWGERMRANFSSSHHVVMPAGFHNVSFTGCLPDLIARFVETADPRAINPSCATGPKRPSFFSAAPAPASMETNK
jgi:pimeloyl-ACP methyl ester carboxylesterase